MGGEYVFTNGTSHKTDSQRGGNHRGGGLYPVSVLRLFSSHPCRPIAHHD